MSIFEVLTKFLTKNAVSLINYNFYSLSLEVLFSFIEAIKA